MMNDTFRYKLVQSARNRVWAIILLHLLFAPVGSAVYSAKQGNWLAFGAGTGIFILGLPFMLFDLGITALILAPVTSAVILCNKATESRRILGIVGPEQADELLYNQQPKAATVTGNVTFTGDFS